MPNFWGAFCHIIHPLDYVGSNSRYKIHLWFTRAQSITSNSLNCWEVFFHIICLLQLIISLFSLASLITFLFLLIFATNVAFSPYVARWWILMDRLPYLIFYRYVFFVDSCIITYCHFVILAKVVNMISTHKYRQQYKRTSK